MNNTSARNDQQSANIIALAASGVDPIMTVSKGERLLWKHLNLLSISSISISSSLYLYLFVSAANEHERNCLHPQKSGYEVMAALEAHDVKIKEEKKMFNTLIDLLSYEKIIFNGQ